MDHIVVASDLSERSDRAIQRGLRLANEVGAKCHVLTIIDDGLPWDLAEDLREKSAARLTRQVQAFGGDASVTALLGDPAATILEHCEESGADLLVVGLHRQRAFFDSLQETTMERIARLSPMPVLLTKEPADHSYQSPLVLLSFSPACAVAVRTVKAIAPSALALDALHAVHIPFSGMTGEGSKSNMAKIRTAEARAAAKTWMAQSGFGNDDLSLSLVVESLGQLLHRKLKKNGYDLLAVGAHTRSGPFAHGLGGFTADLIRNPPTDLLVARP